jgi:hypothetical protein
LGCYLAEKDHVREGGPFKSYNYDGKVSFHLALFVSIFRFVNLVLILSGCYTLPSAS